ncbi:MAG TPA: YdcF family protein [Jatrophihabitans sp.]|jgi:uncharacterized SAM-binding protein YcdF (DUF218 family)
MGWPATRGKRVLLISAICLLALFVTWFTFGWLVIGNPKVDHPKHADAIIILGSPENNARIEAAESLLDQHVTNQLVISLNSPDQRHAYSLCTHPPAGVSVTCFQPKPSSTRGEAEEMRRLAQQHGWKSIVVVTSTFHVSRARMIFKRCITGTVYMVAARRGIGLSTWTYQYLYQTGAYVKAVLQSGC